MEITLSEGWSQEQQKEGERRGAKKREIDFGARKKEAWKRGRAGSEF